MSDVNAMLASAEEAVASADDAVSLDQVRVQYLGKKGELTGLLKGLGTLPAGERPAAGARINEAKQRLQAVIAERARPLSKLR